MTQPFADALNHLLKGAGISGNKLAERLEVDPSQVSRWRNAEGVPRPENIARLATIFGVERAWLLSLAYPSGDPVARDLNPHLSAFLAQVELGWLAMEDEASREVAERGTRALWRVEDVRSPPSPIPPVTKRRKRLGRPNVDAVQQQLTRKRYQSQSVATQISRYGFMPATT